MDKKDLDAAYELKRLLKTGVAVNQTKEAIRARAEVFATFANVAELSDLKKWQREKLFEDAKTGYLDLRPKNIQVVHRWAYRLINDCIDKGEADVSQFSKELARPRRIQWLPQDSLITYDYAPRRHATIETWKKFCLQDLWALLVSSKHLFRRCPICRTVFVATGKKKYCGPKCTAAAIGPRTDYMRDLMRKRRAREKQRGIEDGNR